MRKKMREFLTVMLSAVTLMSATSISKISSADVASDTLCVSAEDTSVKTISLGAEYTQNKYLDVYGRTYYDETQAGLALYNSASGFEVRFVGTQLTVNWKSEKSGRGYSWFSVFVDGDTDCTTNVIEITNEAYADKIVVSGLENKEHSVRVLKRTASNGDACFVSSIKTDGYFQEAVEDNRLKVEIYGDSITMGSGINRDCYYDEGSCSYVDSGDYSNPVQNVFQSYAGYMAQELDARLNIFGRGGIAMKYTSTLTGKTVLNNHNAVHVDADVEDCPYDYSSYTPDVVVIYLGTNDYNLGRTAGTYSVEGLKAGFVMFIREAIGRNYGKDIPIFLCSGMMAKTSNLEDHMASVKEMLKDEFPNLQTVEFAPCGIGHPVASEGEVAGKKLAEAMKQDAKIKAKLDSLKNQ